MFVNKVAEIKNASISKKRKKSAGDSTGFDLMVESQSTESSSQVEPSEISPTSSLFSLQELQVNDQIKREQNFSKASENLENLKKYQHDMLQNNKNSLDIESIATNLKNRQRSSDAKLEGIIDELELRAAVEAAKSEG